MKKKKNRKRDSSEFKKNKNTNFEQMAKKIWKTHRANSESMMEKCSKENYTSKD